MLNVKHLRVLLTAIRLGSVNAAATECCMSQSAATYAIQSLEKQFGCLLLSRGPAGCRPTHAGALLAKRIEALHSSVDRAIKTLIAEAQPTSGRTSRALTMVQLEALAALRDGNFDHAARHLGISAPVIVRRLRGIEKDLGVALLQRSAGGMAMLAQALRLAKAAASALKQLDYARAEITSLRSSADTTVLVGCAGAARTTLMPAAINAFSTAQPDHKVKLVTDTLPRLYNRMLAGELDLVIGMERGNLDTEQVKTTILYENDFALICRRDHPLADQPNVQKEDLLRFDWIVPGNGPNAKRAISRLFGSDRYPRVSVETQSTSTALALTLSSDRIWLSSIATVRACGQDGNLSILPFQLQGSLGRIAMYVRSDTQLPLPQDRFIQVVCRCARDMRKRQYLATPEPDVDAA